MPFLAAYFSFRQNASGEVIFVPSRLDEHHATTWAQARAQICLVPVPITVPHCLRIRILARAYRVVDHRQIGAATGNAYANTGSIIFASARERPAPGRLTVAGQGKLQQRAVL